MPILNARRQPGSARRPMKPFNPSPVPGTASDRRLTGQMTPNGLPGKSRLPALPVCSVGAPPRRPPGVTRPAPRVTGIRGVGISPEIRRRIPGATRAATGAADVLDQVHVALCKAQAKLLHRQQKLQVTTTSLRGKLAPASPPTDSKSLERAAFLIQRGRLALGRPSVRDARG
jgi:hypothetical protein